jgi:hypothetical protein
MIVTLAIDSVFVTFWLAGETKSQSKLILADFVVGCVPLSDPAGTRTQDPYIKSVLLYQLSYGILLRELRSTIVLSKDHEEYFNFIKLSRSYGGHCPLRELRSTFVLSKVH